MQRVYWPLGPEREAAWVQYMTASRRRAAAKAARGVARSTDRTAKMAEEMCQAAGWVCSAEALDHTWQVNVRNHIHYSDLLRCVFGNPFRNIELTAKCVTPDVAQLAVEIYDERAFDRLPILADALEKAGCESPEVLAHCREAETHVRGCWVLDVIRARGREVRGG